MKIDKLTKHELKRYLAYAIEMLEEAHEMANKKNKVWLEIALDELNEEPYREVLKKRNEHELKVKSLVAKARSQNTSLQR